MLFLCYPKCSTCQKAKKWLDEYNMILSILVDTFFTRISMPKLQHSEIRNISVA